MERKFDALAAFTLITDMDDLREIRGNVKENIVYNIEKLCWNYEQRLKRVKEYSYFSDLRQLMSESNVRHPYFKSPSARWVSL